MTGHRRDNDAPKEKGRWDKILGGIARGVLNVEDYIDSIQEDRPTLTELRIKCDPDDDQGVLVILKGYVGAQWMIAFHRDATFSDAIRGAGNRLRNGDLKWREDKPYDAR